MVLLNFNKKAHKTLIACYCIYHIHLSTTAAGNSASNTIVSIPYSTFQQ